MFLLFFLGSEDIHKKKKMSGTGTLLSAKSCVVFGFRHEKARFLFFKDLKGQTVIAGMMFPFSEVTVKCSRVVASSLNR